MTTSLLGDAFAHHIWANERLMDVCAGLTPSQLEGEAPGTYGPIVETLRHLAQSDSWYLSFFGDRAALTEEEAAGMDVPELRAAVTRNGSAWMGVLAEGVDPDDEVVERDDEWEVWTPRGMILAQAIHHGTDHRSQVCTALTSLGLTPPEIDVWAFGRATGRERAVRLSAPEGAHP